MLRATYDGLKPRVHANKKLYWISQWNYLRKLVGEPARLEPGGEAGGAASEAAAGGRKHKGRTVMQWALAYVPTSCESAPSLCRVHINYHGCLSPRWVISASRTLDLRQPESHPRSAPA